MRSKKVRSEAASRGIVVVSSTALLNAPGTFKTVESSRSGQPMTLEEVCKSLAGKWSEVRISSQTTVPK